MTQPLPLDVQLLRPGGSRSHWPGAAEILHTQGHAEGQIVLTYTPADRLLLCGDHVLQRITPNISGLWPSSQPDPLGRYLASLRALLPLAVTLALPGHYSAITDWPGRLPDLSHHHDTRLDVAYTEQRPKAQRRWRQAIASSTSTASARTRCALPSPRRWRIWNIWRKQGGWCAARRKGLARIAPPELPPGIARGSGGSARIF